METTVNGGTSKNVTMVGVKLNRHEGIKHYQKERITYFIMTRVSLSHKVIKIPGIIHYIDKHIKIYTIKVWENIEIRKSITFMVKFKTYYGK